ncbi:hypothetical protein CAP35_10625 [Chitinophagaceae bacterium IBVUCB1]|nr:hypothetical protein CAP35_10625 [Chitinophagaceae bacterium IBVUCB1]
MKNLIICGMMCILSVTTVSAQSTSRLSERNGFSCPKLYVGTSIGVDNPAGAWGINIEVPVAKHLSVGTGAGLSSWGAKTFGELRYYLGECHRGWAAGAGVAYNTGIRQITVGVPTTTTAANTDVVMQMNPRSSLFFAAYRFWNMGKRGHRVNAMLGYAMQMGNGSNYTVKNGHTLLDATDRAINTFAPGGIMIGCGFTFGVIR